MDLDKVTAEIRPRSGWESADLGLAMTREHLPQLLKIWGIFVLPVMILIAALLWDLSPGWALFLIWWLKPVYDRVLIFYLSRVLFSAKPTIREIAKEYPKMFFRMFWWRQIIARLSFTRSFVMPIEELEGLRGEKRRKRRDLLARYAGSTAFSVTKGCAVIEQLCVLSLFFLLAMFLPQSYVTEWTESIDGILNTNLQETPKFVSQGSLILYIIAVTLVEPFYVGAGFGLYINSRTITEGWDIELAFKRLAKRIEKTTNKFQNTAIILFFAALFFFNAPRLSAQEPAAPVSTTEPAQIVEADDDAEPLREDDIEANRKLTKQQLENVFQSEDFKIHERVEKRLQEDPDGDSWMFSPKESKSKPATPSSNWWNFGSIKGLGAVMYYMLLALLVALLAYIIWRIVRYLPNMKYKKQFKDEVIEREVTSIMGMEITPESLPTDLISVARREWAAGNTKNALSLLYRGAIASYIERDQIRIEEGDTEADCLRRLKEQEISRDLDYFSKLTNNWVVQAYNHMAPANEIWEGLCNTWPFGKRVGKGGA